MGRITLLPRAPVSLFYVPSLPTLLIPEKHKENKLKYPACPVGGTVNRRMFLSSPEACSLKGRKESDILEDGVQSTHNSV